MPQRPSRPPRLRVLPLVCLGFVVVFSLLLSVNWSPRAVPIQSDRRPNDSTSGRPASRRVPATGHSQPQTHTQPQPQPSADSAAGSSDLGGLPSPAQREDAHCTKAGWMQSRTPADVFRCRQEVAQRAAKRACTEYESNAPTPPFARANLRLTGFPTERRPVSTSIPMAVEPSSDIVSTSIRASGMWEFDEVSSILRSLEATEKLTGLNPVLLDIGANIGLYTIVMAALGYHVVAFEAMPRNIQAIRQTLCWNPELADRVTLFPFGLGDEETSCRVISSASNVANGNLACSEQQLEFARQRGMVGRGVTHVVRLDDYVSVLNVRVIKLDVEGYEPRVLAGAGSALQHTLFCMSEINADELPSKNNGTAAELAKSYVEGWEAWGFGMRMCHGQGKTCFAGTIKNAADMLPSIPVCPGCLVNLLFERRLDSLPETSLNLPASNLQTWPSGV